MSFHLFTIQTLSVASIIIIIMIVSSKTQELPDLGLYFIITIYILVNLACTLPNFTIKKFKSINNKKTLLTADDLINRSRLTPTYIVIIFLVFISLLPPFAFHIGELPLKLLNIGGNISFVVYDEIKQCNTWPQEIIDEKNTIQCKSKTGYLILQLSDRAYSIFENNQGEPFLVSLNLNKSTIISNLPNDSRYKITYQKMKEKIKN